MRVILVVLCLGLVAAAEPARATLLIRRDDRSVAVRAPSAKAVLQVIPRGAAKATLEVSPGDDGYWRLDAIPLAAGATLLVAGKPFIELVTAGDSPGSEVPGLIEAGEAVVEVPAPASAAPVPGTCTLTLENEGASIRQDFEGADVFICGEGEEARAAFFGHVAPDQAGPNALTFAAGDFRRKWDARVYSWRWTAERPRVARGEIARFRLEIDGLAEGHECDITLASTNGLHLAQAPGTVTAAGEGLWKARVRAGTFEFEAPEDGDAAVTADLQPVCGQGK